MEKTELNLAIKNLWIRFLEYKTLCETRGDVDDITKEIHTRWHELWKQDERAELMNREQLKAMLRINGSLRIVPFFPLDMFFQPNFNPKN